jgi:hypothetical protein
MSRGPVRHGQAAFIFCDRLRDQLTQPWSAQLITRTANDIAFVAKMLSATERLKLNLARRREAPI